MSEKNIAHIVPHTHWDREWRYPIWKSRMVLVEFMDQLLDILDAKPGYKQFVMDGQSVIIEDYLEVRPENTAKVKKYISEGRLTCGPWYTLPDLYPLDGECLVRNLLKGYRVSKEFGAVLDIGYTSFGWGQTAQFPQIFAGFGIDFIVTAKHVDEDRAPESEFWWEAPDGTKVLTTKLGAGARAMFFVTTLIQSKYDVKNDDDYHFEWQKSGMIYHKANADESYEDYFMADSHDTFYPDNVVPSIRDCWEATDATTVKSERLMLAGCDFTGPIPEIEKIIEIANQSFEDKEFKHSTLQEYAANCKNLVKPDQLRIIKGELRDGPAFNFF
jgi:mannosylglycerate hydrolase